MSGSRFRSAVLAIAWRNVHNFFTNPALLMPALLFPLFFFTAFAGGLSRVSEAPGFDYSAGYTAFQFGFVVLQASAFGGVFTGFGMARDFEQGFGRRLMLAATRREAILLGYLLAAATRALTIVSLLFVIALVTGMEVHGNGIDLFGLIGLALLVNAAGGLWAAGIALRFRSLQAGPLMQTPVFLVLFLAPVYVPRDLLKHWIETVASFNPLTAMVEGTRSLLAGKPEDIGLAFAVGAGMVVVFGVWALRGLRSAEAAGG